MAVNLLLSYAFHEKTDLATVRRDLVCGQLMIDSGAFTAHSIGRPVSLDSYATFLERWRGQWDHAITLDVIGDGKASAANTRKLHARGLPVMPVFTRGDKIEDFDAMVRDAGFVCVGGLVGMPRKAQTARIGMLQRRAQDLGGGIHALGIGSITTLRATRPYSADASSVPTSFRYGTVIYFTGRNFESTAVTDRATLTRDRDHLRAHGIDLAQLLTTGRMPKQAGGSTARADLIRSMGVAYAAADEYLKHTHPVPAPTGCTGPDGTNLYVSVTTDFPAAASLDRRLHDPELRQPSIWAAHGRHHTCHRKATPHAS